MSDRSKLIKIIESQSWEIWKTIKEMVDNYEWNSSWISWLIDSFYHIQYMIWSTKTEFLKSNKEFLNYFNLVTKKIFLEDRCYDPKEFVPETIWLVVHETLHCYFSKWHEWINNFIFDKSKPWFWQIVNVFEDFRINSMSWNFMFYWQEMVKSIYVWFNKTLTDRWQDITPNDQQIISDKLSALINFSLWESIKRIWWTMFDSDLEDNYYLWADLAKKHYPNETYIIEEFIKKIVPQYWTYSLIKNDIRWTFQTFIEDLYENIYLPIFKELFENQKNQQQQKQNQQWGWSWWNQWEEWEKSEWNWWDSSWGNWWKEDSNDKDNWSWNNSEDEKNDSQDNKNWWWNWKEQNKEQEQKDKDWKWWWSWEDKEKEDKWEKWNKKSVNPFEWEFDQEWDFEWWEDWEINEENVKDVEEKNDQAWKWKDWWEKNEKEHWSKIAWKWWWAPLYEKWNTEYDEIATKYSHIIQDLYTKLFTVLQKKRDTIQSWFDKWRTVSWNILIQNKLKVLSWQLKNDQLFNWAFKRQMKEWKKALNVIALWFDDSWSMYWDPIRTLKESWVVISEALRKLSVNYCVDTFTQKIFEWDNSLDYKKIWDIQANYWNDEIKMFNSLIENVDKLVKRSIWFEEVNWLYIFITDWYCWDSVWQRIKNDILKRIHEKWHQVFVIWIFEDEYDQKETRESFENIYWASNFVFLDDVKKLPDSLIWILKENFK